MSGLAEYVQKVRERFGDRVAGIYLYGSRARGDFRQDSDTDVAIVLKEVDFWSDLFDLVDLAFDLNVGSETYIQPRPVSLEDWRGHSAPGSFLAEIKRDARQAETLQDDLAGEEQTGCQSGTFQRKWPPESWPIWMNWSQPYCRS